VPAVLGVLCALVFPVGARAALDGTGCPAQPVSQPFTPWMDPGWYTFLPDGGFEAGGAGWTVGAPASVVAGNEPYHVHAAGDARSLQLPAGASAVSPAVCIAAAHPAVRFFVRNTGSLASQLTVDVLFAGPDGTPQSLRIGRLTATASWRPSPVLPIGVNLLSPLGTQQIRLRFGAGQSGSWSVDDVYLDPYGKG
jgi:hypothetical protein